MIRASQNPNSCTPHLPISGNGANVSVINPATGQTGLLNDALQAIFALLNVIPFTQYSIYKSSENTLSALEPGDVIIGIWSGANFENEDEENPMAVNQGQFVNAKYNGGSITAATSYTFISMY